MRHALSGILVLALLQVVGCSDPEVTDAPDAALDAALDVLDTTADVAIDAVPDAVLDTVAPTDATADAETADDIPLGNCQAEGCTDGHVCNTTTGGCEACRFDEMCLGDNEICEETSGACICDTGFHVCDDLCVSDDAVETCGALCAPCPDDPNGTTTCESGACTVACDAGFVENAEGACVECVENSDCAAPDASACVANVCVACTDATHCAHLTSTPVCDAGRCSQCTVADESACQGSSCDPATGLCTGTAVASRATCQSCVADSECGADHRCVPMAFEGTARATGYCLKLASAGCPERYGTTASKTSLSGVGPDDYCGIREDLTTCEAVFGYGSSCASAADCGASGLADALCEPVEFDSVKCTYACDSSGQCDSIYGCSGGYCGGY